MDVEWNFDKKVKLIDTTYQHRKKMINKNRNNEQFHLEDMNSKNWNADRTENWEFAENETETVETFWNFMKFLEKVNRVQQKRNVF